jgi:hypothetical protein
LININEEQESQEIGLACESEAYVEEVESTFMETLPYYSKLFFLSLAPIGFYCLDNVFLFAWAAYSFIPLFDLFTPYDKRNLSKKSEKEFENDSRFLWPLYVYLFFEFLIWIWSLYVISTG